MKFFTRTSGLLFIAIVFFTVQRVAAQSIINPTDSVITYNASAAAGSLNNPNYPAYGTIGKWIRTVRMSWNTNEWKCYYYKSLPYRIHFPKSYNPTANDGKKYPVLIFYHGEGEH